MKVFYSSILDENRCQKSYFGVCFFVENDNLER